MPTPFTWRCVPKLGKDAVCVKEFRTASSTGTMSLAACQLTCGKYGTLWPFPKTTVIGKEVTYFVPDDVTFEIQANPEETRLVNEAIKVFKDNMNRYHPEYKSGNLGWRTGRTPLRQMINITIAITGPSQNRLTMNTADEEYSLYVESLPSVDTTSAKIQAKTYFGARHGLETLSQLIDYEEEEDSLMVVNFADISDQPAFTYRGILLDTSRNFIDVESIKRTLDGMAANKLNTFHWHITDSHSFPMVLKSLPKMAYYGAYSSRELYQPEDIRHLVEYGRIRGIRVLPEFDAPAHVGHGWEWGPQEGLGELAVCVAKVRCSIVSSRILHSQNLQ